MTRSQMIQTQRAIGLPESWKPEFIVAVLPRAMAEVCSMTHELPGPGASDAEWDEVREFIGLARELGAECIYRERAETRREYLMNGGRL